jgi:rhodanese-related sulfurtransferase
MPEVSATEAKQLIDSGAHVIDVRTDVEFEAGHIPGARHIPVADVQQRAGEISKDEPLVVYCRSGNRSGPISDAFAASGYDAHAIEGGVLSWAEAGLDMEPDGGAVVDNPNMPPR